VDRPPEEPAPEDPTPEESARAEERAPEQPASAEPPPEPVSPYGPQPGADAEDAVAPDTAPPARPYEWTPPAEDAVAQDAPPADMAYPPVPQAPAPIGPPTAMTPPPETKDGPGVGAGVATGCGLQVLAFVLFFATAGLMLSFYGALWPFILVTVGSAVLMLSKRWRRFATGALIVCAATWIIVIGPCIAMLQPMI